MKSQNNLKKMLCKATYPLLGNLSCKVKEKIENLLGEENFSSRNATRTSYWSNALAYVFLGGQLGFITEQSLGGAMLGGFAGACYAFLEAGVRETPYVQDVETWGLSETAGREASLPGKIVSLPLDAILYLTEEK